MRVECRYLAMPAAALAILAAALCAGCSRPDPRAIALRKLIDTERDFSTAAATYGMKVAFLRYLDDESILFRPHPVNGKRYTSMRPDSGIQLSWEPVRAVVAGSGDLGWTTGPYRIAPDDAADPPLYGYFVSIWKRQETGRWKVVMDLGTENPPDDPCPEQPRLEMPAGGGAAPEETADRAAVAAALEVLERQLAAASGDGRAALYADLLRDDARLYRDGRCPVVARPDVERLLGEAGGITSAEPIRATVAAAGDLAYTYGSYVVRGPSEPETPLESGYYVRIWQREGAQWKLAVDVTSPLPPEEPDGGG